MKFYTMKSILVHIVIIVVLSTSTSREECSKTASDNVIVKWKCKEEQKTNCPTLNDALDLCAEQTVKCSRSAYQFSVEIYLNSSKLILYPSLNNTINESVSHFSLIGRNNNNNIISTVDCNNQHSGLKFYSLTVNISNVAFHKCGDGTAALMFFVSSNISLQHVMVEYSNGSGLYFKVTSNITVIESTFYRNLVNGSVGGGVAISVYANQLMIHFYKCNFVDNQAQNGYFYVNGGGMSITIEGKTENVHVMIEESQFIGNIAEWGAGLFCRFAGSARNNLLTVRNTNFKNNCYNYTKSVDLYNAGGGALVQTLAKSFRNKIYFHNCTFFSNSATWGGGLAWYSSPNTSLLNLKKLNYYHLVNSTFIGNNATVGSAISIYCKSTAITPELCNAIPVIKGNSVFTNNGQGLTVHSRPSSTSESTLHINGFVTYIGGTLTFRKNFGTPLFVRNTAILIKENTHLIFKHNTAETGGGIALYESWMTVSNGSQFKFIENTALTDGGAIYAHQSADLYVPHVHNCFIRYRNSSFPPWQWGSKFLFDGNKANDKNNSIYATSIIPCGWNHRDSTNFSIKTIFCKWGWTFENPSNCSKNIFTSVRSFGNTQSEISLSPGIPQSCVMGVDDLGHNIPNLSVIATIWPKNQYFTIEYTDYGLIMYGKRYSSTTILLQVNGDRNIFKKVNVTLTGCPPGYGFLSESSSCECYQNDRSFLLCNNKNWTASLLNGFCMTFSLIHNTNQTVYGRCVFSNSPIKNNTLKYIPLPQRESDLDVDFCGKFKRTGLLCGKCLKNYSIDVFSTTYSCHRCSSSVASWITFICVGVIPPLVLFLAILLLHISFTGGSMNGYIFFCQVVTLSQEVMVVVTLNKVKWGKVGPLILDIIVDLYSVWSLDNYRIFHSVTGHRPLCLGENLQVIQVLTLHYISALYPFLLIVIAYAVIELHARNCRVLVWLWKPSCFLCTRFRRSWKPQASLVDAFAAFIILSYVKLVRMSLLLLTYTDVISIGDGMERVKRVNNYDPTVEYLSREHVPYVLLGSFFLLIFGILPPLLLLFYQFKVVQRCLTRCRMNRLGLKTFMDAFQGCYKDGRNGGPDLRYFAGLYLIFRVVIFVLFNLQNEHIITYFTLVVTCVIIITLIAWVHPYKVRFYNQLDVFFIGILTIFFGLHIIGFSYLETNLDVPVNIIIGAIFLCSIPLLYMVGLVVYRISRRCYRLPVFKTLHTRTSFLTLLTITEQRQQHNTEQSPLLGVTHTEVSLNPQDDIPDRLVNPQSYATTSSSSVSMSISKAKDSEYSSINH